MAPYVVVPMPHKDDESKWTSVVLPIDFLSLPQDVKWVWDPCTNDVYKAGSHTKLGMYHNNEIEFTEYGIDGLVHRIAKM